MAIRIHRWLGLAAALIWLLQVVTGTILSFHFEIEDALLATRSPPTDLVAIEQRMGNLSSAEEGAAVNWIWTTAGLSDRYVINFTAGNGEERFARVNGAGEVLRNRAATDHSFLTFVREIHLTLAADETGHWILAATGTLLVTNLAFGLAVAWPRRGRWRSALSFSGGGDKYGKTYSWHRAFGLWGVIPALFVVGTGTLTLFEHPIEDLLGVEAVDLPSIRQRGTGVGFAAAANAAVEAIPGSRFVGTTLPSAQDASYHAWVRAPGELYRGGYGGSLVIVNANDGSIRGAFPATEHDAARAVIASFYPLHTGEAAGTIGRVLVMIVGLWLTSLIVLGLWLRRTRRRAQPRASGIGP